MGNTSQCKIQNLTPGPGSPSYIRAEDIANVAAHKTRRDGGGRR